MKPYPPLSPKLRNPDTLLSWRYSTWWGWTWAVEPLWELDSPAAKWTIRDPDAAVVAHAATWHEASAIAMRLNNEAHPCPPFTTAPTPVVAAPAPMLALPAPPGVTQAEIEQRLADWAEVFAIEPPKRIDP